MKNLIITIVSLGTFSGVVFGASPSLDWQEEAKRITLMRETLQKQTIEGFMEAVRSNRWDMPRIPSKWFVDTHVADKKEKQYLQAVRGFGYQLTLRLEDLAQEQQALPQGEALFQRTLLLCDLEDWCAAVAGYGNWFLAQRCLNLTVVGLARLTALTEFPFGKCEKIAARMTMEWMKMPYRLRVLNGEANADIFINVGITDKQLSEQWSLGWTMMEITDPAKAEQRKEWGFPLPPPPDATLVNVKAFTNSLHFFALFENTGQPYTLSRAWDCRQHQLMVNGRFRGSMQYNQAMNLFIFRSAVGFFPPPYVRSEEEDKKLDTEIAKRAELGIIEFKHSGPPSLEEAFRREWETSEKSKETKLSPATVAMVYSRVLDNTFFDPDMDEIQRWKQNGVRRQGR